MSRLLSPSDSDGVVPERLALQLGSRASTHKLFFGPDLKLHWRCNPEKIGGYTYKFCTFFSLLPMQKVSTCKS